jgi:hypothetical protein
LVCSWRLIPAIDSVAASLFPLLAGWLTVISYLQWHPSELDKPHILALAAEAGFLLFKEQVPLKFKKECNRKAFRLTSLSTPVIFCWTVPLSSTYTEAT